MHLFKPLFGLTPGGEIARPLLHISDGSLDYEVVQDVTNESTKYAFSDFSGAIRQFEFPAEIAKKDPVLRRSFRSNFCTDS